MIFVRNKSLKTYLHREICIVYRYGIDMFTHSDGLGENLLQRCRIWLSNIPDEIFTTRTCWPCYLWLLSNKWRKVRENQRQRSKNFKKSQKIIIHVKLKNIFISKNFFSRNHRRFHDEQIPSWKSNHNIIVLRGGTLHCCAIFKCYHRQTKHCTVLTGLH